MTRQTIAIIGAGISGLGAAWLLAPHHDITVYESEDRIGGHSHTVDVDYDGLRIAVDTGFIVYNRINYPNLCALFEHLDVPTENSHMGFSVSADGGKLEWAGNSLNTIFAQRRNLANPSFLRMLYDIVRFNARALEDVETGRCADHSLQEYLQDRGFGESFRRHYLLPMGAAIWSTSLGDMLEFPAETLIRFFANHRLLSYDKPIWRTVSGGSRTYVTRLTAGFQDRIRQDCGAVGVERTADGVWITDHHGERRRYDQVIMACHSDQALTLLRDADAPERSVLGDISYSPNTVYLHRDTSLMPKRRSVWTSWNVLDDRLQTGRGVSLTYWMNNLQNLDPERPLFVSLNPVEPPRDEMVFRTFTYAHPQFDRAALTAQRRLPEIQGQRNTWFCGAWTGYGFHEDGLASGLAVAERAGGVMRPWAQASDHTTAERAAA